MGERLARARPGSSPGLSTWTPKPPQPRAQAGVVGLRLAEADAVLRIAEDHLLPEDLPERVVVVDRPP